MKSQLQTNPDTSCLCVCIIRSRDNLLYNILNMYVQIAVKGVSKKLGESLSWISIGDSLLPVPQVIWDISSVLFWFNLLCLDILTCECASINLATRAWLQSLLYVTFHFLWHEQVALYHYEMSGSSRLDCFCHSCLLFSCKLITCILFC